MLDMMNVISKSMLSLEAEDMSGRTSAEIERVVYVRVKDFKFLDRATGAERQEQWSVKIPKTDKNTGSGSIRVRKSINLKQPGAATTYILATKLDIGTRGNCAETPEASSVDQFNIFKYFADTGMIKDRYYFPIEGSDLNWEVDCFSKPGAMYEDWVKIDLERWPRGKELPALPMEFTQIIDGSEGMVTPESAELIDKLYQDIFLTKNTMTPLKDYGDTENPDQSQTQTPPDDQNNNQTPPADGGDDNGSDNNGGSDNQNTNDDDNSSGQDDQSGKTGDDNKDDLQKEVKKDTDDLGKATTEAWSSLGQIGIRLVPVLGPLMAYGLGQRGAQYGLGEFNQHTTKTTTNIDSHGRKSIRMKETGTFRLSDLDQAEQYIDIVKNAVADALSQKSKLDKLELFLWPQKDGKYGLIDIRSSNGTTKILTENNPGKLKWFSLSVAGKRMIKLTGHAIENFHVVGRTIECPFDGKIVEFDISQLRHLKYETKESGGGFEIVNYNFDA